MSCSSGTCLTSSRIHSLVLWGMHAHRSFDRQKLDMKAQALRWDSTTCKQVALMRMVRSRMNVNAKPKCGQGWW